MSVTYDVYVKERGRWFLECEFRWDEREEALGKAESLTRRRYVQAVKVIRERYDRITRLMTESTIFDTTGETSSKSPERLRGRAERDEQQSLGALDIWVEDEEGLLDRADEDVTNSGWDADSDWENADGLDVRAARRTAARAVRKLFSRMFAIVVLSIGLATLTTSMYSGALLRIL